MVDNDGGAAALGLRALAGIVDDEGIEVRQWAEDCLREAAPRQCQCLAWQPFEIAVFAHVDDGLGTKLPPQEGVEGEIAMRRHEIGRVIGFLGIDIVATGRLDADHELAEAHQRQREETVKMEGIGLRRTPTRGNAILNLFGKTCEKLSVISNGKTFSNNSTVIRRVGRASHQSLHQSVAVSRQISDIVTRVAHRAHDLDGASWRIQTNAIAQAAIAVRVIGHDQGDPAIRRRGRPKRRPIGGEFGDESHAAGIRLVANQIGLDPLIEPRLRLERDGAGQHPAINFRQSHAHRQIARAQALGRAFPSRTRRGREDGLQNHGTGLVEHRRRLFRAGRRDGETGGVDDHRGRVPREDGAQSVDRNLILEAGDEDRQRNETLGSQGFHHGLDRGRFAALDERAVEAERGYIPSPRLRGEGQGEGLGLG